MTIPPCENTAPATESQACIYSMEHLELGNGSKIPQLGLGTYKITNAEQMETVVLRAITLGYRHFDTAAFYQNEAILGAAIRKAIAQGLVKRQEIFVVSKLWNSEQGYPQAKLAIQKSQAALGLGAIDLYLIHWPIRGLFTQSWRALEEAYEAGQLKSIGVSNFAQDDLKQVMTSAKHMPLINQIEFNPYLQRPALLKFCQDHQIKVCAWSPLARGQCLYEAAIVSVANKHQKLASQVVLRWQIQRGLVSIPKASDLTHLEHNFDIFDFDLSQADMRTIDLMDRAD